MKRGEKKEKKVAFQPKKISATIWVRALRCSLWYFASFMLSGCFTIWEKNRIKMAYIDIVNFVKSEKFSEGVSHILVMFYCYFHKTHQTSP